MHAAQRAQDLMTSHYRLLGPLEPMTPFDGVTLVLDRPTDTNATTTTTTLPTTTLPTAAEAPSVPPPEDGAAGGDEPAADESTAE